MQTASHLASPETVRAQISLRLRAKSPEIEGKIIARIRSIPDAIVDGDTSYLDGLEAAVSEALSYGIDCVEGGGEWSASIPPGVIRQARRAARDGVSLNVVLRRYAAGNKVLEEFIVAEARDASRQDLCRILSDQGPQFDRLMAFVAAEYEQELDEVARSPAQRRTEHVLRLLSGDDRPEDHMKALDYDFEAWHLGMIVSGEKAEAAAHLLSERLGYRLLHVPRENDLVWGWLGNARQPVIATLMNALPENLPAGTSISIGEPRKNLEGWRLTHFEAQMAYRVAQRQGTKFTRGRDVALLACILEDETLIKVLLDTYLAPIEGQGRLGPKLRETLRAYFSVGESTSAAAEDLGVSRHTVRQRIRTIESTLEQPFHTCNTELQLALQLQDLIDKAGLGPRRPSGVASGSDS